MYKSDTGSLIFSPSDLTKYIESEFVTWMDRYNIEYPGTVQPDEDDPTNILLQKRGQMHEAEFLQELRSQGRDVVDVSNVNKSVQRANTVQAMKEGREVIFQGALQDEHFHGYADFLIRTTGSSSLGDCHYEPWDTKLALKTKPYHLVQLACYADMLSEIQGRLPRQIYVVLGDRSVRRFRTEDYLYYYRQLRKALLEQQQTWDKDSPPDFVGLEQFGRWSTYAKQLMEDKDHLCRVANIRTVQIKKLYKAGIMTMTDLANSTLDNIPNMQQETYATLQAQARLQIESAPLPKPKYEIILPQEDGRGLTGLPPASQLDVYFDIEGFPFAEDGLEYLLGVTVLEEGKPQFYDWWAHNSDEEKKSFEDFIDWIYGRWKKDPRMHIYHYASYEKTAIRRLMGKYGTKEKEVDDLLRNEVLVDLYSVVRQSMRVGEPSYSLKYIEHLYKENREADVSTAIDSVVKYQEWLDQRDGDDWRSSKILRGIRDYNIEDCESTWQLTVWLREFQKSNGIQYAKSAEEDGAGTSGPSDAAVRRAEIAAFAESMLQDISADTTKQTEHESLQMLLAYLVEFHWREAKPVFWAKFDRAEMSEQELYEDPGCLYGLQRTSNPPEAIKRSFAYEYTYDSSQDTKIDSGDSCFLVHNLEEKITVDSINPDDGLIYLKRSKSSPAPPNELSLIRDEFVDATVIAESIFRTAISFMAGKKLSSALEDFLSRSKPKIRGWTGGPLIEGGIDLTEGTVDVVARMESSTLCIQGPPGSGKTYTAARAIAELIRQGKRVGVTSNSHKAIANLMEKAANILEDRSVSFRAVKVQSTPEQFHIANQSVLAMNSSTFFKSGGSSFDFIGGTAWLFSREDAVGMVDYLFVDEAGQVSVANLVGMAPSTDNLVLIGDQMQLSQPIQGTHPGDSGQSILEYLLQDEQVVPDDFGIFLGASWRMHPNVCSFISGAVYEDRLKAKTHTKDRELVSTSPTPESWIRPSGIVYVPVEHEGNVQDSEEEALVINELIKDLLKCEFRDGEHCRPMTMDDFLVVAPYNMQVRRLRNLLPLAKVGSVDKFQGQEAPVVIVSMCSSTGDSSPRGLDFIFSKNRLNVAISRAKALALIVGSPALARTHCKRVEQMELVNLFCRIVEVGLLTAHAV